MYIPLILAFFALQVHPCPDRWALNNVDIWTHNHPNGRGEHRQSINIHELTNNEMISVTKANVSVLCDSMIRNFPKLKFLSLIDANISKIEGGAFQNLPLLTHLSLAVNHLSTVQKGQFQNLEQLEILYLSKNQIENVDTDAFHGLLNLKKVYLDRNKLHEIDGNWFVKNSKISVIDVSMNGFSKVQKGAFSLPPNSMVEIRLQNNIIEDVEAEAIISSAGDEEIPYVTVHLDHNKLTGISKDLLSSLDEFHTTIFFNSNLIKCFEPESLRLLKTITVEVHAEDNPLSCDCLEAATNFVKDNEIKSVFNFTSSLECQLPGLRLDSWGQQNSYFNKK